MLLNDLPASLAERALACPLHRAEWVLPMRPLQTAPDRRPLDERASFATIRYANCWEDAEILARAVAPLDGARCLSIASAGDNTLSLVARGAASVVAVDLSPAQLALMELKMAAFGHLTYEELLGFLGVRGCVQRRDLYLRLRSSLGEAARTFWDARSRVVESGVIHAGRLERYFGTFRRFVLPLIHSQATVAALLGAKDTEARRRFYDEEWDGWRWRALVQLFFSRPLMKLGRDPEFLRYAPGAAGTEMLRRARRAFTGLATHDNPYLSYILTGGFGEALPDYLRPERFAAIREGLRRVRLCLASVQDVAATLAPQSVDVFNLSDVPEYMHVDDYHLLLVRLRRLAAPGARFAYWNLLAPRQRPVSMAGWLDSHDEGARVLLAEARAFFYRAFVLEVAR